MGRAQQKEALRQQGKDVAHLNQRGRRSLQRQADVAERHAEVCQRRLLTSLEHKDPATVRRRAAGAYADRLLAHLSLGQRTRISGAVATLVGAQDPATSVEDAVRAVLPSLHPTASRVAPAAASSLDAGGTSSTTSARLDAPAATPAGDASAVHEGSDADYNAEYAQAVQLLEKGPLTTTQLGNRWSGPVPWRTRSLTCAQWLRRGSDFVLSRGADGKTISVRYCPPHPSAEEAPLAGQGAADESDDWLAWTGRWKHSRHHDCVFVSTQGSARLVKNGETFSAALRNRGRRCT